MIEETPRLFGPEMLADPYPVYHRLRVADPVHRDEGSGVWVLTRYADVVGLLRSPHVSSERMRLAPKDAPPELQAFYQRFLVDDINANVFIPCHGTRHWFIPMDRRRPTSETLPLPVVPPSVCGANPG